MKFTKTVMIALTDPIPETELNKDVTITIGTAVYKGVLKVFITHEDAPVGATVTLEAPGLKVKTA